MNQSDSNAIVSYILLFISWFIMSIYITIKNYGLTSSILQALFIISYTYFGHWIAHILSIPFPFNYLNPHVAIHHNHETSVPRWLNLIIEAITNFSCYFVLILLQWYLNVDIISTSLLLFGGILYTVVHILHYSIFFKNNAHMAHHKYEFCNYSPIFMDILFNTLCDPNEPYPDMYKELISTFGVFLFIVYIQSIYKLK